MRRNKPLLFASMGFLGGNLGALCAEIVELLPRSSNIFTVVEVAIWVAFVAVGIAVGLKWAVDIYSNRSWLRIPEDKKILWHSLLGGLLVGAIAQAIFTLDSSSEYLRDACWGIMGGLLGWALSRTLPNLGSLRGGIAGTIGGLLGGGGFILLGAQHVPEILARMLGIGIVGAAVGLSIVVVERIFREAYIEVEWAKNEKTIISLGAKPVTIGGGGEDTIFIRGLMNRQASLAMANGKILCQENQTRQTVELKDGSKLHIGTVVCIIHAK